MDLRPLTPSKIIEGFLWFHNTQLGRFVAIAIPFYRFANQRCYVVTGISRGSFHCLSFWRLCFIPFCTTGKIKTLPAMLRSLLLCAMWQSVILDDFVFTLALGIQPRGSAHRAVHVQCSLPCVALSPTTSLYTIISSAPWGGCFKNSQQCHPVYSRFPSPKTRLANKSSWMPRDLKGFPRIFTSCVEHEVEITIFKGRIWLLRVSGNTEWQSLILLKSTTQRILLKYLNPSNASQRAKRWMACCVEERAQQLDVVAWLLLCHIMERNQNTTHFTPV